jgi:hypothetical protein
MNKHSALALPSYSSALHHFRMRKPCWIEGEVQEWLAVRIERSRGAKSD